MYVTSLCIQVAYNRAQREKLISAAKAEMKKQEIKKQAKEADEEVMKWLKLLAVSLINWYSQQGLSRSLSSLAIQTKEKDTI